MGCITKAAGVPAGFDPSGGAGGWTQSSGSGLVCAHVRVGATVKQGDLVAGVEDYSSRPPGSFLVQRDGIIGAICHSGCINADDWAIWLLGAEAVTTELGGIV